MDIFEGTEQIHQGIIARAISGGRLDPLRQDRWPGVSCDLND